ncbi:cysteine-tryptophan domain-containing zinc finger protein 7-like [Phragmites australis]|uniref:cysteine-tryptophan domain-containing zinc finger protein 7-like n=1 Tax=Phragmites australis TaxID=29695 RepID=UPI002D783C86|nr:cysteine-tryptophan domain-containing zinc finger protein 7-like [Phragmites australis]
MLSVRRRQEDAGGGGGVAQLRRGATAMDDDAELEEGEACGDDTAFVDPDVALSYIDKKLQDVLGHFQKDFEGGVSAENLGSKFGGYGSFLPTYQRSPLPQTRSPPKAASLTSRSPCQKATEGLCQNPSDVAVPSVDQNNGPVVHFNGDSSKKEICSSTKAERGSSTHDSLNGPSKYSDQNRFKVRIKVGPDNVLARNNAAIYSGLGLDISSPSSIEDSPDGRGSLSPEVNNVPLESPRTILQIMTCFSVPGGFLLSPLQGNVLQLTKKLVPSSKMWESNVDIENVQEKNEGHVAKKIKSDGKKKKLMDTKSSKNRNDVSAVMRKDIDIETSGGQKIVSEALNIPLLSDLRTIEAKGENQFEEEPAGITSSGNKDAQLKERAIKSDSVTIKAEYVKAEAAECLENSGFSSSEVDISAAKGEVKPKTEKTETTLEERNTTSDKNLLLDRKQERKVKSESKCNTSVVNFEGSNVSNERAPAVSRNMGRVNGKESLFCDTTEENNSKSEARRVQREQKINAASSSDILEDDNYIHSSAAVKERKSDLQSKSNHSGKKPKAKSHRDVRDNLSEGSYGVKEHDILENGSGFGDLRPKEKSWKNDGERDSDMPGTSRREISSSVKHDRHTTSEEQKMHIPPPASVSTANAAPTLPAPVIIKEHWVFCDICHKWRLLPYEMNPSNLPKKWKCSMLQWLPGMNRCDISEEETTNALNALYVIPAPANGNPSVGHPHVASAGLATSSTFNVSGHAEQNRKRKNVLIDGNVLVEGSHPAQASVHPMSNHHAPTKIKSSADGNQYPIERDSVSKSVDPYIEKKRSKSKNRGSYSDGGDLVERSKKHPKVKSKRDRDHDEYKSSKKSRKDERHHFGRDWNPGYDLASGDVPGEAKALPAKATALKSSGERSDVSSKQKNVSRYNPSEKPKGAKDEDVFFPEDENKESFHPSDAQKTDLSSKKRIVKEWEESQHNSIAQVSKGTMVNHSSAAKETYKDQNFKETKSKLSKSEELILITDSKTVKVRHADQILSYDGGHINNELVEDNTPFNGKRGPSEQLENQHCEQALDLAEPASSDVAYFQSTAVTSSSSKASGSQKKKQNIQVSKTSPVESLSSSPQRNSNIDKLSHSRALGKDGSLNANSSTMRSTVKQPNTEVGLADNIRQASESLLLGSSRGNSDKDNGHVQLTQGHASDGIHSERGSDDDLQHESGRKDSIAKGSRIPKGYNHLHSGDKNSCHTDGSPMQPGKPTLDSKTVLDTKGDSIIYENKKITSSLQDRNGSTHYPPDENPQLGLPSGKEKSYIKSNRQDMQKAKAQTASPTKESKVEFHSTPLKSNVSKSTSQLRQGNVENGGQHSITKQAISNPADTSSPARKDGTSAAYALKEARDLKHKANRLKEEGKELESTRLYFEAALKFLHVASLLEPPNVDGLKQGDAAQSMYSDTAKLCNFVGHAYEKCKKMAAAALAYKCVEVAYLKAAYYKYPTASKDRQVLQAVVQTAPGESPSSSASDIDNLNNNGLTKVPSSKDANSPQVAGNHLLLAVRNQPHLTRLLAYTNDINSAFDATRKSQSAIASAAGNHENGMDGLSTVRTVLDFNFRNVNDLLRLVRLSMESISC